MCYNMRHLNTRKKHGQDRNGSRTRHAGTQAFGGKRPQHNRAESLAAIVLFYKQVELRNGLPFEVTIPTYRLDNVTKLSDKEYDARLEPGYQSARAGRARALSSARADFRRKHRQGASR